MNGSQEFLVTAAGRVNLIGEHIDYCGGKVLPAALSLKNAVRVRPNGENCIRLAWTTLEEKVTLDFSRLEEYRSLRYGNYQAGCALLWRQAGHALVGCDMVQDCSVPFGSGLSSSAAIEVATAVAMRELTGETYDLTAIALLSQKAENTYCGVNCGIMDQFASAMGKKDKAILLIVANCNKPHALVTSKYNERRAETDEALSLLQKELPEASCLADITPEAFEGAKHVLSCPLLARAQHVVYECARVKEAAAALKTGDIQTLAKLINASHDSLSKLYEVTGKEPDALAYAARETEGCIASRMIGAGFGGCTISLVEQGKAEAFKQAVGKKYTQETGYTAAFYDTSIEDGVKIRHF